MNMRPRSGISLLEVLMAIFVISVGLLGVAALLPLAQHLANRGATADRAALAGKRAMEEFKVREMTNPDNWLTAAGVPLSLDPFDPDSPLHPLGAKAFCLDPRGVTRGVTADFAAGMPRLTLRQWSGGAAAGGAAMSQLQADDVFTIADDLNFEINRNDASVPPVQILDEGEKRFSDNEFSWMATLVRERDGERYTLSVVVFFQRNNPTANDEQAVAVNFLGSGVGGAEVRLTGAGAADAIPGRWLMLASGDRIRWYRVIYAAEFKDASTPREVTLAGRDWDGGGSADAVIIPGTVAVYERTIRLETSSLWQH